MNNEDFPLPVRINGRLFFDELATENFKRKLIGLPELPRDPAAQIKLKPAKVVAEEFGFGRRTLGRRIAANSTSSEGEVA